MRMPSWQDVISFFTHGWAVIRDAPGQFALALLFGGLIIWGALSWKYTAQLDNKDGIISEKDSELSVKDATIKQQEDFLAEYRGRLNVSTPKEAEDKLENLEKALSVAQRDIKELREGQNREPHNRHISDTQRELFVNAAEKTGIKSSLVVTSFNMTCLDCDAYSQDFDDMIAQIPGWVALRSGTFFGIGYNSPGITVMVHPGNPTPEARALIDSLRAAKFIFNVLPRLSNQPTLQGEASPHEMPIAEIEINPQRDP